MRIVVLAKQVPRFEEMTLGEDGRLLREGVELELNPYCRRAVSKGAELAAASGGRCTVVTLGPEAAEDCLREAIAWGATDGVLLTDRAHAGSDTLATARALAAALRLLGDADLVLCGRNSVDADTGQVPPAVAELLGLPFAGPARELEVVDGGLRLRCETDDGFLRAALPLPALVSCAERLCEPAKVDPAGRAAVPAERIRRLEAASLGEGPWGQAGSPTWVGRTRTLAVPRRRRRLVGDVETQARAAVAELDELGALDGAPVSVAAHLPGPGSPRGPMVVAVAEPQSPAVGRELCAAAAHLAATVGGCAALVADDAVDAARASSWGADRLLRLDDGELAEDAAAALHRFAAAAQPWAILLPGTAWGRELGARTAAALGAGLCGDAVELAVDASRLVAWKPAFGGSLVAAITSTSPIQMATVRPGVVAPPPPRPSTAIPVVPLVATRRSRVVISDRVRDDELETLATATTVIGVGTGVPPAEYAALEPLRLRLGAELGCTRKVTDKGWMPRSRQVGITGRSIAPRLYVSIGAAGKFNHIVGFRAASLVLAINSDPEALIFDAADLGIVAPWREAVAALLAVLPAASPAGV